MTEEELLAAMQKVVRAEIALERAKMKAYVDAKACVTGTAAVINADKQDLAIQNFIRLCDELDKAEEELCQ